MIISQTNYNLQASTVFAYANHLANSYSSLKTQFSPFVLCDTFPDSAHKTSYGTCCVKFVVSPTTPIHEVVRSLLERTPFLSSY